MKLSHIRNKVAARYSAFKEHPITRKNPNAALFRYFWFNTTQSLFPKKRIYEWVNDLKFYAEKGDAGIVANYYFKLFDYEESMFLMNKLNSDDLFVDVGANLGHFSLLAAGISNCSTIAIEPIPTTFKKLTDNVRLNNLESNVSCMNCGVGDSPGILNFIKDRTVMNRVALEGEQNTVQIRVETLDDILGDRNAVFLKIDVEGFEYPVLKGAHNTLKNPSLKYLMLEFNNSGEKFGHTDSKVFDLVKDYGFIPVSYDVANDKIVEKSSFNTHKFNTLLIRH